eukprot:1260731-Prymnesium_polylepis.1
MILSRTRSGMPRLNVCSTCRTSSESSVPEASSSMVRKARRSCANRSPIFERIISKYFTISSSATCERERRAGGDGTTPGPAARGRREQRAGQPAAGEGAKGGEGAPDAKRAEGAEQGARTRRRRRPAAARAARV